MKVSHVSNATRMWVSLVEHTSLKDDKTSLGLHNVVLYKKLSLELTQHYSIPENRAFQGRVLFIQNSVFDCSLMFLIVS